MRLNPLDCAVMLLESQHSFVISLDLYAQVAELFQMKILSGAMVMACLYESMASSFLPRLNFTRAIALKHSASSSLSSSFLRIRLPFVKIHLPFKITLRQFRIPSVSIRLALLEVDSDLRVVLLRKPHAR